MVPHKHSALGISVRRLGRIGFGGAASEVLHELHTLRMPPVPVQVLRLVAAMQVLQAFLCLPILERWTEYQAERG